MYEVNTFGGTGEEGGDDGTCIGHFNKQATSRSSLSSIDNDENDNPTWVGTKDNNTFE